MNRQFSFKAIDSLKICVLSQANSQSLIHRDPFQLVMAREKINCFQLSENQLKDYLTGVQALNR